MDIENMTMTNYNIDRTTNTTNENNKQTNNEDTDKSKLLRKKDKQKKYRAKRALKAKGSFDESAKDTTPAVALDANVVAALRSYIEKIDDQSVKSSNVNHSSSSTVPATSTAETIDITTAVEESVNLINVDETIDFTTVAE